MDCESLSLALQSLATSIQYLASSPSNFVLHRTQCCCLARSYALAVQHVIQQVRHALSICQNPRAQENLIPSLSELHHAMLQGRKFMGDCLLQDGWVKKAVILALSTGAQDVCLHDLVWCLCVIQQAIGQLPVAVVESENDVYSSFNAIWSETSQKEDLATLLDALTHEIAGWERQLSQDLLSTDSKKDVNAQCCLAKFLLQKLLMENDLDNAGVMSDTLPKCLWVDPLQFTIKEAIGHGAYAVVYEVEWHGEFYGQKEFFEVDEKSFGREAAIQARLRHPNLLQLICCTSKPSRNKCSLVVELMDMNMKSMIDNRHKNGFDPPFSLLTAVDLMLQISKGMEYLHNLHIMHRDLKSHNLLVTNHVSTDDFLSDCRSQVKIADFGMSKAKYQSSKFTTLHTGTTCWRAPEVFDVNPKGEFQCNAKYTKKADVYSFAMVCYEILTGKVPFDDGGKLTELHPRLLKGERPNLPSSCPQYLASYIERCWHANPGKRPSFAQISRTLRHLKGILLTSAVPFSSLALSGRSCTIIEDELEQIMGADWVSTVSTGLTMRSMTITFEMSWYKVMESKLTEQEATSSTAVRMNQTTNSSENNDSELVHCFMLPFHRRRKESTVEAATDSSRRSREKGQFSKWVHRFMPFPRWKRLQMEGGTFASMQLSIRRFTYAELKRATNHFGDQIGAGGYSLVYKGILADGGVVAVKVMERFPDGFLRELEILGRVRHRNLVPFLGFCSEKDRLLLVYKFMPRGDLQVILMRETMILTWAQKYEIVRGIALGLDYLHNARILHRDVKPSNILLDDDYEACLADFGLSRIMADDETHVTTNVRGTWGYLAPEYVTTLKVGPEADVYSFGVVVLELASGRSTRETPHIVEYVWTMYKQKRLLDAVDERTRVEGQYDGDELRRLLLLGLACSQMNPRDRPIMTTVVRILSGEVEAPTPVRLPYYMEPPYLEVEENQSTYK